MHPMPLLYRASQGILAPGARDTLTTTLRSWSERHEIGDLVLDVGCGPTSWLNSVGVQPIGVDLSRPAIRAFGSGPGTGAVASATALPFRTGAFDSVWCFGLLHHLPEHAARAVLGELQRVTKPGGHAVVFDGILPTSETPFPARLIRRFDRGRWMRSRDAITTLLGNKGAWHDELVRYSRSGLEGVLATWTRR